MFCSYRESSKSFYMESKSEKSQKAFKEWYTDSKYMINNSAN